MQRFYVTFPLPESLTIDDENIYHQFVRVLRGKPGEQIIFFNGDGYEYKYVCENIQKKTISFHKVSETLGMKEPSKKVTLYQALPNKNEKIEYIIEKGIEVGVSKFVFFRSDRSQKLHIGDAKIGRFHSIAKEALEQCGGTILPPLEFHEYPILFENMGTSIVLDTTGDCKGYGNIELKDEISLWVGPEGGWSENERKKMKECGFIFVRFGERVMRTETAGVVVAFSLINR